MKMEKMGSRTKEFLDRKLGESDEAFRHMFNISPEAIILLDMNRNIIDINRSNILIILILRVCHN